LSEKPDEDSKTEEPTEKKLFDAVEKGNTPVSREVGIFASILGMIIIARFFLWDSAARFSSLLAGFIENPAEWRFEDANSVSTLLEMVSGWTFAFLLPIVTILILFSLAAAFMQNPPSLVLHRIKPDFSKLSLAKGFKRVFGTQGWVEFAKAMFKFLAVGTVVVIFLKSEIDGVFNTMLMHPAVLPHTLLGMILRLFSAIATATVLLVGADILWSRKQWFKNLKMTKQEVKDEHKQQDGDPIVKARRLSLARDRLRRQMIAEVPKATVVITNPTHFSVALAYDSEVDAAPRVIAKGQDLIAFKIREIAEKHSIPLVENKYLARSLYAQVEVEQMIPEEFYRIVAEIIHFVSARKQ